MTRCIPLALLLAAIGVACASSSEAERPRFFNSAEFPGLVDGAPTSYEGAKLDFELHSRSGGALHIKSCPQVAALDVNRLLPSNYPQYRLLAINCEALKVFTQSRSATRSFLPPALTVSLIESLPATAVPTAGDEDRARRQGKRLAAFAPDLDITVTEPDAAVVASTEGELFYVVMGRGDVDDDGSEDLLLRVQSRANDALGAGVALFIVSRRSEHGPVTAKAAF